MAAWLIRLHQHDERLLHALVVRRGRPTDRLMGWLTHLGDAATTITLTLVLISGLLPDLRIAGIRGGVALVLSHGAVQLLKRTVARSRPRLPIGYGSLVAAPDRFSFPSGHAAAALSIMAPLAAALPGVLGPVVLMLALLIGVSRCYLGVHYPGDVVAGWVLALAGLLAAAAIV